MMATLAWRSAAGTHVGKVREINEDSLVDLPGIGLWAVADGMGGHEAGDVASKMVIEELSRVPPPISREALLGNIEARLRTANGRLREYGAERGGGVVGSTAAVLACHAGTAQIVWAGDSRIYLFRDGVLEALTQDHSQIQELVRLGLMDPDEAESHPAGNVITRAVGAEDSLELDVESRPLAAGDVFLLCSDGLTGHLKDDEIAAVLANVPRNPGAEACEAAVARFLDLTLERGARDNVTVVVVQVWLAD